MVVEVLGFPCGEGIISRTCLAKNIATKLCLFWKGEADEAKLLLCINDRRARPTSKENELEHEDRSADHLTIVLITRRLFG